MRAVLSVEGVFLNVSDSPESQVRAMWEMRETDAYQLILADIGQVPGWLDDVHRTDMAEASTGSEAADYRDKRLTSTTSEAAETESDEASANCSHCGNPMIHAIPIAAAVELAVSANGPSHSDRLALVERAVVHLGNIVAGRLVPGSLDPVSTASFDLFRSWTLGIDTPT
jgi:hypothetical protein